jgi:hypothetical protein
MTIRTIACHHDSVFGNTAAAYLPVRENVEPFSTRIAVTIMCLILGPWAGVGMLAWAAM